MSLFNKYSENIWQTIFIHMDAINLLNIKKIDVKFQNFIEKNHILITMIIKNVMLNKNNLFFLYDPIVLNSSKVINEHPFNQCLQRIQSYNWSIYMYSFSEEYYSKIINFFDFNKHNKKFITEYSLINIYKNNEYMFIS